MSGEPSHSQSGGTRRNPLRLVREEPRYHWPTLLVAIALGLILASVHWLGLVIGGALVGLVATSLVRALLAGFGFGLTVLSAWIVTLWWAGSLGDVLAMGEFALIPVAMGLLAPVFGSLVRGVV